ncbi:MAG: hypothetical protein KKB79_02945 [Nanoarchaeota archaeon]|nr:hypothetical protein [Nanoarchaeota archaeon]
MRYVPWTGLGILIASIMWVGRKAEIKREIDGWVPLSGEEITKRKD